MLIYLVRENTIPIEQCRGIETFDRSLLFILVKASVEAVSQTLCTLKQMNVWVRDVYERQIDIQLESTFVFQFRGHPWSIIYKPYVPRMQIDLRQEDASTISESLGTSAIYYAASDTSGTIRYQLYNNGACVEKLSFEEEFSLEFQSQLRQMEARDIQDAYTFTMSFIREQDAYIPCFVEVEDITAGERINLRFEDLLANELERMDYLAQQ